MPLKPPPKRIPYSPATAAWDFLAVEQCDESMNPTPLGLCVEAWYQLTYLETECPLPERLQMLKQQLTLLLNRKLPHLIPELRQHRPFPPSTSASGTPSV